MAAGLAASASYYAMHPSKAPISPQETRSVAEQAMGDVAPGEGVRRDIMAILGNVTNAGLVHYGQRMARDLQSIMLSSEAGQSPLESWESLVRTVACANHLYGVDGVHLYTKLKSRTVDTPLRLELYQKAQKKILSDADRNALAKAQSDLSSCVKY